MAIFRIRHEFQSVLKVKIYSNASEIGSKLHTNASNCLKAAKISFLDKKTNKKSSKSAMFETSEPTGKQTERTHSVTGSVFKHNLLHDCSEGAYGGSAKKWMSCAVVAWDSCEFYRVDFAGVISSVSEIRIRSLLTVDWIQSFIERKYYMYSTLTLLPDQWNS